VMRQNFFENPGRLGFEIVAGLVTLAVMGALAGAAAVVRWICS